MSIQNELNKVKNAVYGSEVRGAIHDALQKTYDDASEKGNANMEVKIARGTHPNLRSRLEEVDDKQQQTTAQLQQTTAQLQQTIRLDDSNLTLNNFTESDRAVIQGLEAGQINAVLGPKNVRNINIGDRAVELQNLQFASFGKNRINESLFVEGEVVNSAGQIQESTTIKRTNYIYLDIGDWVYSNKEQRYGNFRYAIYGLDKSFKNIQLTTNTLTVTEPCYVIICDNVKMVDMQLEQGSVPTPYEKYQFIFSGLHVTPDIVNETNFRGKKIGFIGDSITEGTGFTTAEKNEIIYPVIVAKQLGMELINYGVGGSAIAVRESDPAARNPIVTRYHEMEEDLDIVVVAAGTNDWAYTHTPTGDINDWSIFTLYGALHNLCVGLLNRYPGKVIVFMTPIKRRVTIDDTTPNRKNGDDKTLHDVVDIIKEVCTYHSIPTIDMYSESMITPFIDEQRDLLFMETNGAGVHPNSLGHEILARRVTGGLRSIIGTR